MIRKVFRTFFPDEQKRMAKRSRKTFLRHAAAVERINELFDQYEELDEEALRAKSQEFKDRIAADLEAGKDLARTLDAILPEAFAAVKQACKRLCGSSWEAGGSEVTWEMVPYDVQLAGGIELHNGNIAEMATGEGKTLVAVLPLYLNALTGRGAHLITVNDYLARRDSEWMGSVFGYLGLTVGCILTNMTPDERRKSYGCDITYGTNNEFGFDYLRDNMAVTPEHLVQREHYYAIIDEVDSVLIDEARTPLIISGTVDRSIEQYAQLKPRVADLVKQQSALVNRIVGEAEELLQEAENNGKDSDNTLYEGGIKLLQARKGYPKHRKLTKVMSDAAMQKLVLKVEHDFMADKRIPELEGDLFFVVDEKGHSIDLTQLGRETLSPEDPDFFLVPDMVDSIAEIEAREELDRAQMEKLKDEAMVEIEKKTETIHSISQLLRAYTLYEKDDEYVVQENKVIIVDEFTGRLMSGRRWSDGLHQAVEAKEGVTVEKETQTLATITLQNYFRMYDKLAGMTGTAISEEAEFAHTYKMEVAVIPTHRNVNRLDDEDLIYRSEREKYNALLERVAEIKESGMPVLIGTTSVDISEKLSRMLRREEVSHSVLNAKHHDREAQIVREAGHLGAVTIATNMAGRGTDIKLAEGVVRCRGKDFDGVHCAICPDRKEGEGTVDEEMVPCGLQIIGTERHEARRIDRQLRGRSGRQGDPGYSLFYISLEDKLMRLFASDRMASIMSKGFEEGEAMSHAIATSSIGKAQKKIEEINFERRKKTLEYDDVMNKQRAAIYGIRRRVLLDTGSAKEIVLEFADDALAGQWSEYAGETGSPDSGDPQGFFDLIRRAVPLVDLEGIEPVRAGEDAGEFFDALVARIADAYDKKIAFFAEAHAEPQADPADDAAEVTPEGEDARRAAAGERIVGALSRWVILNTIDQHWRDHLLGIDELREGIYLRSYGQLNPLTEYQREATILFEEMMYNIYKAAFEHVFRATIVQSAPSDRTTRVSFRKDEAGEAEGQSQAQSGGDGEGAGKPSRPTAPKTFRRSKPKVGPNSPCPCGSGKKHKKCCGRPGAQANAKGPSATA